MTYRQPAFMVDHPVGQITDVAASITPGTNTAAIAVADKRAWGDYRQGNIGEFTATSVSAGIFVDLEAVQTTAIDRCVIPAGHNFDGETFQIWHDDNGSYTSPTQVYGAAVSGSGVMDLDLSPASLERYWAIQISTSSSETFQMSQFWLGVYDQLSADAVVGLSFENGWASQVVETKYPSGPAMTELAAPRRTFSLNLKNIDPAGADYATLDSVLQNGRARPFWYWPPDTTDAGPFLVHLDGDGIRRQEYAAPQAAIRYGFSLRMVETKL